MIIRPEPWRSSQIDEDGGRRCHEKESTTKKDGPRKAGEERGVEELVVKRCDEEKYVKKVL